jgi:hypothetical protein
MRVLGSTPKGVTFVTKSDVKAALRAAARDAGLKAQTVSRDRVPVDGKEVDRYRLPVTGGFLETLRVPGSPIVFHTTASGDAVPAPTPEPTVKGKGKSKPKAEVVPLDASEPAVRGSAALDELSDLVGRVPGEVLEGLSITLGLPRQASPDAFASAAVSGGLTALAIEVLSSYLREEAEIEAEREADQILEALVDGTGLTLEDLAGTLTEGDDVDLPF